MCRLCGNIRICDVYRVARGVEVNSRIVAGRVDVDECCKVLEFSILLQKAAR